MLALLLAVSVTHGVSIGEVSAREAILWSRSSEPAAMRVELDEDSDFQIYVQWDAAQTPDPTFRPRVLYAEGEIFNFGYVRIEPASDGTSRLYADIRDETGAVRVGSALELVAQ